MTHTHPLAMASGIMPEATPLQLVEAAARAGFDFGGMWMDPEQWTDATTRAVAGALRDTGLRLLDIEVVWIKPGPPNPNHLRIVDVGAELGARNVLCVSSDPDVGATRDKLGLLMEHAERNHIRLNLEFGLFTEVKTIHQARRLLSDVDGPAAGLLVDSLHWQRSGGTLGDIEAIPKRWLSYIQLCDAPMPGADPLDGEAILTEAIDGRVALDEGGLPLREIIERLPDELPIAVEERSKALRDAYPDLNERACAVLRTSRAFLERLRPQSW
jgi:sugar phosphate isomerase/epimerase